MVLALLVTFFLVPCIAGMALDTSDCNCPKNGYTDTRADTVFHLSNGVNISLCGDREQAPGLPVFSEFELAVCGADSVIDFWGATESCHVRVRKGALIVESLESLPVGPKMRYMYVPWYIEKIKAMPRYIDKIKSNGLIHGASGRRLEKSYKLSGISRIGHFNMSIPRYSLSQIQGLLKEYRNLKKGPASDRIMEFADKLFIATISGSSTARKYFMMFPKKWSISGGALQEQYDDLVAMLALFDEE